MLLEHDPKSIIGGDMVLAVCIYLLLASPGYNLGIRLFTILPLPNVFLAVEIKPF